MNNDFKNDIDKVIIPSIKKMLRKEKEHLEFLKQSKEKFEGVTFQYATKPDFKNMIAKSKSMKNHLEKRLKEYVEYSEKITE